MGLAVCPTAKIINLARLVATPGIKRRHVDRLLNINTSWHRDVFGTDPWRPNKLNDAIGYMPSNIGVISLFIRHVKPTEEDVLYDMGCGKGLVNFTLAPFVRGSIGIDHNPEHVKTAFRNLGKYSLGPYGSFAGRVHFFNVDVIDADISNGNIYYFYRPFRLQTFLEVMDRIRVSLAVNPRPVTIFYFGIDQASKEFTFLDWLIKDKDIAPNVPISIYRNERALERSQKQILVQLA